MSRLLLFTFTALTFSVYAEGGFYVGIGTGYASLTNIPQGTLKFANSVSGTQTAGNIASTLYIGYDFNKYIGLQEDYNVAFNTQIANSYNTNQQIFNTSLILHLPFDVFTNALGSLAIFAKGGGGFSIMGYSNTSTPCNTCINPPSSAYALVPTYGAGLEYGFTNVGLRLEWDYSGNVTAPNLGKNQVMASSNMYLLSVLYHF